MCVLVVSIKSMNFDVIKFYAKRYIEREYYMLVYKNHQFGFICHFSFLNNKFLQIYQIITVI